MYTNYQVDYLLKKSTPSDIQLAYIHWTKDPVVLRSMINEEKQTDKVYIVESSLSEKFEHYYSFTFTGGAEIKRGHRSSDVDSIFHISV